MGFYDDLLLHSDTLRGAGGVSTMMVGQAFIKSLAFACNDWALHWQGVCVLQAIVCP